ncbi:MAG: cation transporter [Planctomycetes bacterium]|nr:cation transporter [Planctomycetota bacterium]
MSGTPPVRQTRKVSVLYFDGCPNHQPTADLVRALIKDFDLDADVEEVELASPEDVERLHFLGSPTVQVNGLDIEPAARSRTDYAMSCRLYKTPDGLPSRDMLVLALGAPGDGSTVEPTGRHKSGGAACCCEASDRPLPPAAMRRLPSVRGGLIATGGSVVAAVLSSACCWAPLLLVAFGASAAGVSNLFGPWRPFFIAAAVTMLALSFYQTFIRKPAAECCSGEGSSRRKLGRATWWVSAVVVAAFVFFPKYVGLGVVGSPSRASPGNPAGQVPSLEFAFRVDGMHCEACATSLTATLSKVEGVTRANVEFGSKVAQVDVTDEHVIRRVLDATRRAGFSVASKSGNSDTP